MRFAPCVMQRMMGVRHASTLLRLSRPRNRHKHGIFAEVNEKTRGCPASCSQVVSAQQVCLVEYVCKAEGSIANVAGD